MSWKDCDCGMARICAEIERCSTCEIAAHKDEQIAALTRERDEAIRQIGPLAAENERLRGALEKAKGPIAIAATYADEPGMSMGMRTHTKDCASILPEITAALAGEGEAETCTRCGLEPVTETLRICHGCSTVPGVVAPIAGEGEVHRWGSLGDFIACEQCGVLRGQASDEEACPTPEKARQP